jgi:hypothetical protein
MDTDDAPHNWLKYVVKTESYTIILSHKFMNILNWAAGKIFILDGSLALLLCLWISNVCHENSTSDSLSTSMELFFFFFLLL